MARYPNQPPPELERFAAVAEALDATGGFKPRIHWAGDENGLSKPEKVVGPCHLVPYPRESSQKFAARAAVAVYENHLESACSEFVGYLAKKPPVREGADGPLSTLFVQDADRCGNALDVFWLSFMLEAKARGSMLLLMDMPEALPPTLAQQVEQRKVPYLTAIRPERLRGYELDPAGRFVRVGIASSEVIDGSEIAVVREWDAASWRVLDGDKVLKEGPHGFGRCPVLALTERGLFPCFGRFEQIAILSRRVFNAQSELDEILRSQTFSLLTYQIPPEAAATFSAGKVAAEVGTSNMLTHSGDAPAFIAPDSGPAETYMKRIDALEVAIRRIGLKIEESSAQTVESGLAKQVRFQALNAALVAFATRMQDFERQVWDLFATGIRTLNRVRVTWPTDYTLADTQAELDKLTSMQASGFAEPVLTAKRKQITAAEFASLEQDELAALLEALDEPAKETEPPGGAPGAGSASTPPVNDDGGPPPPGAP